jgi:hypothetical protein
MNDTMYAKRKGYRLFRSISALACLALVIAVSNATVFADGHDAMSTGSVMGMLHITPDAAPRIGTPSQVQYHIMDSKGSFDITACACRLSIQHNGELVYSASPAKGVGNVLRADFTFPSSGDYVITASGYPIQGSPFHPFSVSQPVHISQPPSISGTIAGGFIGAFAGAGLVVWRRRRLHRVIQ